LPPASGAILAAAFSIDPVRVPGRRHGSDEGESMTIAVIVGICVILLILAFLAPRLSRHPERGVSKSLSLGGSAAGKAPGPLGRWLRKPFGHSQRATSKSASKGREGRSKLPL
jgi:hypothetical protein